MPQITSHKELVAWQLCDELADAVCALLAKGPGKKDLNLCDQLHRSADSPAPAVAEGFGRKGPKEFAYYLRVAVASLRECSTWLERGIKRGYWPAADGPATLNLCWRALDITSKLLAAKERQIAREQAAKALKRTRSSE